MNDYELILHFLKKHTISQPSLAILRSFYVVKSLAN